MIFIFEQLQSHYTTLFKISSASLTLILYWRVHTILSVQHIVILPNLYLSSLVYGINLHCVNQSRTASNYIHTNCVSLSATAHSCTVNSWPLSLNCYFLKFSSLEYIFLKLIFSKFSVFTVIPDSITLYCCQLLTHIYMYMHS